MNVMIASIMIMGLLFGGGVTVNAAQNDMPNEPLYALKLWSEDVGLQFQNSDEARVNRLMDLAQVRLQEMKQLAEAGQPVPDQVRQRLEQHIQQALQTCTNMDDPTLERTLLRIRNRLQQQERDMELFQLHIQDQYQTLTQTRTMLRERLQFVEDGLLNHEMFRNTIRNGFQHGQEDEVTPPIQNGNGKQDQNGQSTSTPNGTNTDPDNPNTSLNGPNTNSGNPDSGGSTNNTGGGNSGNGGTNGNGYGGNGK